jgi:hypothetical protein
MMWMVGYMDIHRIDMKLDPMIYPTKEQYQVYDIWIKSLLRNIKFFLPKIKIKYVS